LLYPFFPITTIVYFSLGLLSLRSGYIAEYGPPSFPFLTAPEEKHTDLGVKALPLILG